MNTGVLGRRWGQGRKKNWQGREKPKAKAPGGKRCLRTKNGAEVMGHSSQDPSLAVSVDRARQ